MLNRETGGRDLDPPRGIASSGHRQGTIREVPASQLYHLQWHVLRLQDGRGRPELAARPAASGTFQPPHRGASTGTPERVVIGCFVEWHMRGAIELRWLHSGRRRNALVAMSVENGWQGRGIGTALMAQAVRVAHERGIEHLYLTCHALNHRMQRIAERFGARIGFENCACFAVITPSAQPVAHEGMGGVHEDH